MKYQTAVNLIDKMLAGKTVKLRRGRVGGISSITWCMLCDVMFYRGIDNLRYLQDNNDNITISFDNTIVSENIILY
jgi:hypothetical protein